MISKIILKIILKNVYITRLKSHKQMMWKQQKQTKPSALENTWKQKSMVGNRYPTSTQATLEQSLKNCYHLSGTDRDVMIEMRRIPIVNIEEPRSKETRKDPSSPSTQSKNM